MIGTLLDITERKQAEEQVRESQQRFQALVETIRDWIWEVDEDGLFTYISPRIGDLLGYKPEEFLGKAGAFDFMLPEEAVRVRGIFDQLVANRQPLVNLENTLRHKDGRLVVFETNATPFFDLAGKFKGYRGVDRDITERKQAEEALSQKTALLEAQLNSSIDGILVVDNQGKKILQNQRTVELWKIPKEIADNPDDQMQVDHVMHLTKDPDQFVDQVKYLYSHPNETSRDEIELKDGTVLDRYSAPVIGSDGRNYGRIWSFRDITERKRMEEELRQSEEQYRKLVETMRVGLSAIDANGVIIYVNDQMCQMLGYAMDEMIGHPTVDFYVEESKRRQEEIFAKRREGFKDLTPYEVTWVAKDGHQVNTIITPTPRFSPGGEFTGAFAIFTDITELKQAEAERLAHLWFIESMVRVNEAMYGTDDLEKMMSDVLAAVLSIFNCDRASLVYPCDPEAASWRAIMEQTRPEYPGALALGLEVPVDQDFVRAFRTLRASSTP